MYGETTGLNDFPENVIRGEHAEEKTVIAMDVAMAIENQQGHILYGFNWDKNCVKYIHN